MTDTAAAIKTIFEQMPNNLNKDVAEGMDSIIQYELTGDDACSYFATIKDGACTMEAGQHDAPQMTITMAASDFVDMIEGRLDGMTAFMSGKLQVGGDMSLAMKMQQLFSS